MMKITIMNDESQFDYAAALRIVSEMSSYPHAVIGLATGNTTQNMYGIIEKFYMKAPWETSKAVVFNVDEVMGVPRTPGKYCYSKIWENFAKPIGILESNIYMPDPLGDLATECSKMEAILEKLGGIDLQILGIGENGHIGFNQPGTKFGQKVWVCPLLEEVETRLLSELDNKTDIKLSGFTLGMVEIMRARRVILMAKGSHKAQIIKKAVLGPVTEDVPASVLQLHPNCEVLLDASAAAALTE